MNPSQGEIFNGGVTTPKGFTAATAAAGIRSQRDDLALLVSESPAIAAGMFTTNRIQAAPVRYCRDILSRAAPVRAIIVNSGNANACTGAAGMRDTKRMAAETAATLDCNADAVLVCSTGTIGVPLPINKISDAIPGMPARLSQAGGDAAARAIMTTDTREKHVAVTFPVNGVPVTIGGMVKGAGMIEPCMATLLAFITTDAAITPTALQSALQQAVDASFNRVTVDGDQSTNDTVLFLANGQAGNTPQLVPEAPGWDMFTDKLSAVCRRLAYAVVADGEGATKVVEVTVRGAVDAADAAKAARAVARSLLVKTSWTGADPNWGRVMAALGVSGAVFSEDRIAIAYDDLTAVHNGCATDIPFATLRKVIEKPAFRLTIDLGGGIGEYMMWSCDCTEEYVRINAAYMT